MTKNAPLYALGVAPLIVTGLPAKIVMAEEVVTVQREPLVVIPPAGIVAINGVATMYSSRKTGAGATVSELAASPSLSTTRDPGEKVDGVAVTALTVNEYADAGVEGAPDVADSCTRSTLLETVVKLGYAPHDTPPVHVCSGVGELQFDDDVDVSQKESAVLVASDAAATADHCTSKPAGATMRSLQFAAGVASEKAAGIVTVIADVPTESVFTFVYGASIKNIVPGVVGTVVPAVNVKTVPPRVVENENRVTHGVTAFAEFAFAFGICT